jgi:hypothetical protein
MSGSSTMHLVGEVIGKDLSKGKVVASAAIELILKLVGYPNTY